MSCMADRDLRRRAVTDRSAAPTALLGRIARVKYGFKLRLSDSLSSIGNIDTNNFVTFLHLESDFTLPFHCIYRIFCQILNNPSKKRIIHQHRYRPIGKMRV